MTAEHEILTRAARVLSVKDDAVRVAQRAEKDLQLLCREYEKASGTREILSPHHLAQACRAMGVTV